MRHDIIYGVLTAIELAVMVSGMISNNAGTTALGAILAVWVLVCRGLSPEGVDLNV